MQGPIAQAAALAIYGNDRCSGHERPGFWPGATVFNYCKSVRFVALDGDLRAPVETPFADDPVAWIGALRDGGIRRLRLHYVQGHHPLMTDRLSVAFAGGGGRWLIEALHGDGAGRGGDRGADLWEAKWSLGDRKDPERRIWTVAYGRVQADGAPLELAERPLTAIRHDLEAALAKAEAFATARDLAGFAAAFREARETLTSATPLAGVYHTDMAPTDGLLLEAKQLLAATQAGWVFGGMGSWNDLSFPGAEGQEYDQLSEHLFALMVEAIHSAVNVSTR